MITLAVEPDVVETRHDTMCVNLEDLQTELSGAIKKIRSETQKSGIGHQSGDVCQFAKEVSTFKITVPTAIANPNLTIHKQSWSEVDDKRAVLDEEMSKTAGGKRLRRTATSANDCCCARTRSFVFLA